MFLAARLLKLFESVWCGYGICSSKTFRGEQKQNFYFFFNSRSTTTNELSSSFWTICDFYEERVTSGNDKMKPQQNKLCQTVQYTGDYAASMSSVIFYCVNNCIFYLGPATVTANSKQPRFFFCHTSMENEQRCNRSEGTENISGEIFEGDGSHVAD